MSRCTLWCVMTFLLTVGVLVHAAESPVGMVYANGTAWINGSGIPNSAAMFSGDLLQTGGTSNAVINATGLSVKVLQDTLLKVDASKVHIEHGAIHVATSRNMAAQAGEVIVAPKGNAWTEFEVTDVDGRVQILAQKGELTVTDGQGTSTLSQGQETTRDESSDTNKKKHKKGGDGAPPAAKGTILDSTKAIIVGSGVVAGVATWVLLQDETPLSPSCPSKTSCN